MEVTKISLNAGELSDDLAGRIDLQKVQMGCEVAENVRVLRVGGLTRRAGFQHVAPVRNEAQKSRLQGFRFSEEQGVVFEFANLKMRVFRNGAPVMVGDVPFEVDTPWTSAQAFALQFAQRVDTIVVTHPEVEPQLIRRTGANTWTVVPFPWQERVWELVESGNVQMSVAAKTGSTVLTASAPLFDATWEGTRIRLGHTRAETPFRRMVGAATTGSTLLNLATTSYTAGQVVYVASPPYIRAGGKYSGLTPLGNRSYFTFIANYNHTTDFTAGTDPDSYPAFLRQGVDAVAAVEVEGRWEFETAGTWGGTFVVERSYDSGATWQPARVVASNSDKNYLVQDIEDIFGGALFRVLLLDLNSGDIGVAADRLAFTVFSSVKYGHGVITSYTSPTAVAFLIEKGIESTTATTEWFEDAFNPKNGYPKTCTFHQKRLFFGGSVQRPQTIWASRTREVFNFRTGTLAEDGMSFETEATEYESVLWLVSHLALLVGTTSGIWAITSPDGMSLTPENNAISRQVRHGVQEGVPGVPLQNNVLFLQTKGRKIHELTGGSVEYGGYTDVDLTQLASHITRGGVDQLTNGEIPDSTLYAVTAGELAVLTYERAQDVVGWTRWLTAGDVESVATCPGGGEDDDIYLVVRRGTRRFVERLAPDMLRREEQSDMPALVFLDSSLTRTTANPEAIIFGLEHLEGLTVEAFADGESQGMFDVLDGKITLIRAARTVTVGLPYTSLVRTMPLDQGTVGRKSSLSNATLRLRNSLGGEVSQDGVGWSQLRLEQPRITDNVPLPLATGDAVVTLSSTWQRKPSISIRQTSPLPMTLLAIRVQGQSSQ